VHDRPNVVIQRGRQGNFGERGAASLSMLALLEFLLAIARFLTWYSTVILFAMSLRARCP